MFRPVPLSCVWYMISDMESAADGGNTTVWRLRREFDQQFSGLSVLRYVSAVEEEVWSGLAGNFPVCYA